MGERWTARWRQREELSKQGSAVSNAVRRPTALSSLLGTASDRRLLMPLLVVAGHRLTPFFPPHKRLSSVAWTLHEHREYSGGSTGFG